MLARPAHGDRSNSHLVQCSKNWRGLPSRNVDRSAGMLDIRDAQLYSVFYYESGWSLAAGVCAGRLKNCVDEIRLGGIRFSKHFTEAGFRKIGR